MKKRVSFLLAAMLSLALAVPAWAAGFEEAQLNFVTDEAGILTDGERAGLEQRAEEISNRYECGVYIIVMSDFTVYVNDDTPYEAAKSLYTGYSLGYGPEKSGVLLMLSMAQRNYALIAYGYGNTAEFTDNFKDDDWQGGLQDYLEKSASMLRSARDGHPLDIGSNPLITPVGIAISLAFGFAVAFIICWTLKERQMKSVAAKAEADTYLSAGSVEITRREDLFTHTTQDAEIINEEIAENFGPMVSAALDDIADGQIPGYCDISYEDYRSGGILSLVVKLSYYYEPSVDYVTYCYDMDRGVMLHNAGVLKALGVTEEAYLHALGRAAAKSYDGAYFSAFDADGAALDGSPYDYQNLRISTLSGRNLSLDLPLYLDDRGIVHVLTPIGSHAGPDCLYEDLALDLEEDGRTETAQLGDYLTATLRNNTVTLRIERTEQLEGMHDISLIDPTLFGTELEVHGLYGSYTRMFCTGMGMVDAPYVFLLTEEGRVEHIDVLECLTSGYFCGCGPILGVEDVVDFELAKDGINLSLVQAVTGSGQRVDLRDLAALQRYTLPESYCGESWTRYPDGSDVVCYLKLRDGNGENFSYDIVDAQTGSAYTSCDGNLAYLGITEQGAVYGYYAWQRYSEEPGEYGAVALERRDEYGEYGWESVLYVTELTGENAGNVMEFSQAVG